MKVVWRKKAADELEAIYNYIRKDIPQNALLVFNRIFDLANSLIAFPEKYPSEPVFNSPHVRFAVIHNYKVIYSFTTDTVYILRIFSTRQHPRKLKP